MTSPRRIVVVTAGVSRPSSSRRLADRLADATVQALHDRHVRAEVRVVEVRDLAHDVVDATLGGDRSAALDDALRAVESADGLIAVSPVFNASIAGLFKSFVDLLAPRGLGGIPTALGVTGGSDRHSLVLDHALRPVLSTLHAAVVPTGVHACSADLGDGPRSASLHVRIDRAGRELAAQIAVAPAGASPSVEFELAALLRTLD